MNLEQALRRVADDARNLITDDTTSEADRTLRDASELIRVLARMVAGKTVHQAFGAPGDWGYETPIGAALYSLYSEKRSA